MNYLIGIFQEIIKFKIVEFCMIIIFILSLYLKIIHNFIQAHSGRLLYRQKICFSEARNIRGSGRELEICAEK